MSVSNNDQFRSVSAHVEQRRKSFKEILCFQKGLKLRTKPGDTIEKLYKLVVGSKKISFSDDSQRCKVDCE